MRKYIMGMRLMRRPISGGLRTTSFREVDLSVSAVVIFLTYRRKIKESPMAKAGRTADNLRASLRAFISSSTLPLSNIPSFADNDSFLEKGILDSTGVLEVVGHIEKEYGIRVEADEIIPDNLDSIDQLAAFIEKKTAGQAP
jgi:acyl carrier protein